MKNNKLTDDVQKVHHRMRKNNLEKTYFWPIGSNYKLHHFTAWENDHGGEFTAVMSERLSKLALPNSHLVEAVLKEHYHIFNDECRERLKRLLQLILSANQTGTHSMNEIFKRKYIRNLRRRIQCLENAEKRKQGYSMKFDKIAKIQKLETHEKLEKIEIVERYGGLSPNEKLSKIEKIRLGDQGDQLISKKEALQILFRSRKGEKDFELMGQAGDCGGNAVSGCLVKTNSSNAALMPRQNYKSELRQQWTIESKKRQTNKNELKPITHEIEDCSKTPILAVHYYMVLMNDMQRNCDLYQEFIKQLLRPTQSYKQPYLNAAYKCWLEYLEYIKHTLDYLQPYIMNQMKDTQHSKSKKSIKHKLPKVLINSLKNMRFWRKVLHDSVECCRTLIDEPPNEESMAVNIHHLYVRYYKKINTLVKCSEEVKMETQKAKL